MLQYRVSIVTKVYKQNVNKWGVQTMDAPTNTYKTWSLKLNTQIDTCNST
jgi:hypothetical protein